MAIKKADAYQKHLLKKKSCVSNRNLRYPNHAIEFTMSSLSKQTAIYNKRPDRLGLPIISAGKKTQITLLSLAKNVKDEACEDLKTKESALG